jgi:hypothetical protein
MTGGNLVLALRSLCEIDPPEVTGQGTEESSDRGALASLFDLGALVHIGNSESVLCFACDRPHSVSVEYAGDGLYRAYCADSGYFQVAREPLDRASASSQAAHQRRRPIRLLPGSGVRDSGHTPVSCFSGAVSSKGSDSLKPSE